MTFDQKVGVIGAGSFGTAIANLLAHNVEVLIYSRNPEQIESINKQHRNLGVILSEKIKATDSLELIAKSCTLIFPMVPSDNFREMMQQLSPFLHPYHIIIHGTKGLDVKGIEDPDFEDKELTREEVSTMSEVIMQESLVIRVGCLSGPNLAQEIIEGQPTATVIGSKFGEVIKMGKEVLKSSHFHVFGTFDLIGAELAGALKNMIAIGAGILKGVGMGKNIEAMLITRGLMEMIYFGQAMGATSKAFFGTAGIGDLIATATSNKSRNFTFGYRIGKGESLELIRQSMPELAEGVRTLKIAKQLAKHYKLHVPITEMLYQIVFENEAVENALQYLMSYPYDVDVDFL